MAQDQNETTTGAPQPGKFGIEGVPYMDVGMLEHYRNLLMNQREQVTAHLSEALNGPKHHPTSLPDEGDQASKEAEMEMELQEINRQRTLLKEIDGALERMHQGEYGYCESCGLEIGVQRLNVRPVATLCVDCKTLEEVKTRGQGW